MKTACKIVFIAVGSLFSLFALSQPLSEVPGATSLVTTERCLLLHFEIVPFTYTEDFTTSIRSIGQAQVSGGAYNSSTQGFGLGMVHAERNVQTNITHTQTGCHTLTARLGYIHNTLFVGRELRTNSCAFAHVKTHEEHHITLYTKFITSTLPKLLEQSRSQLEYDLQLLDDKQARKAVEDKLYALLREVKHQHDAFDNDGEYNLNSTVCGGAIRRIVRGV